MKRSEVVTMKKIFILTVALLLCIVIILACVAYLNNTNKSYTNDNFFTIIPIENVKGISLSEAETLCYEKIGKVATENGYALIYIPVTAGEYQNKQYYIFRWQWLVENHHYSTIGYVAVLSDGMEIRDAVEHPDGEFEFGSVKWKTLT